MKNLRLLLALATVSVVVSACGSDPVSVPDEGPQLRPRYETSTTTPPFPGTNSDPGEPTDPGLPGSGGAVQVLGSGT